MQLHGICPVMVTPMLADGTPDEDGIHRLVDHLLDNGAVGLWILGSASEEIHITRTDRIRVIRATCTAAAGRLPVISGTGLTGINEIIEFIGEVADSSVAGIHALYLDHKQSEGHMIAEMSRLADASPVPIWLYNNRNRGRSLTPRIIRELREHRNIGGVKIGGFACTDLVNGAMMQSPDFQVVGAGGGGQCFTMLCLGCTSHTASDASCWPEEYAKLFDLFRAGDIVGARQHQFGMVRLTKGMGATAKAENGEFSAEEKYILSLRGVCDEHVNPSYRCLTDDEKAVVRAALRDYGFDWAPSD